MVTTGSAGGRSGEHLLVRDPGVDAGRLRRGVPQPFSAAPAPQDAADDAVLLLLDHPPTGLPPVLSPSGRSPHLVDLARSACRGNRELCAHPEDVGQQPADWTGGVMQRAADVDLDARLGQFLAM